VFAEQEFFRQRRALIGEVRLISDQRDGELVAAAAECDCGLKTGLPGTNDHQAGVGI